MPCIDFHHFYKFTEEKVGTEFVPTFFSVNLKLWHQKIGFGTGHQDIGQKL